jgi:hypothetical protein
MSRQHRIVQSQPQAGHDRQRSVDDISFLRMLEAWLRTVGTEHKHHSNISTAPSGEIPGGPGHDNPRQPQCRATALPGRIAAAGSSDVLLPGRRRLSPADSGQALKSIQRMDSCQVQPLLIGGLGRLHIVMDDGSDDEIGPGDVMVIPRAHDDAWTVGKAVHFSDFSTRVARSTKA